MQELGIGDPTSPTPPTLASTAKQNGMELLPNDTTDSDSTPNDTGSGENETETGDNGSMSAVERKLMSEWVPLCLSFGIPLFDEEANKIVSEKVKII